MFNLKLTINRLIHVHSLQKQNKDYKHEGHVNIDDGLPLSEINEEDAGYTIHLGIANPCQRL